MEALPGFDAVAAAERALGVALKGGGLERAPELVVTTARQARDAWTALLLQSPVAAEAAGGLARCAGGCEGRAVRAAHAAAANVLPLPPHAPAARALRQLLADADASYAQLDEAFASCCGALGGSGGVGDAAAASGNGGGEGEAGASARLRADAACRRGDAARYGAETLEAQGGAEWSAALGAASAQYARALALYPGLGRAHNLLGVVSLLRGDEAVAASRFLRAAAAVVPFPAGANATALLAAAAARPLQGAGGLAESRVLRCAGDVLCRSRAADFDAAAWSAATSLQASLAEGALPEEAALRCVVAAAAAVRQATPPGWRDAPPPSDVAPPEAWPDWMIAALRLMWGLAPPLLRAAAGADGRYLAAASALCDWLRWHAPLAAAPPAAAAEVREALAQLLNAGPLRIAAAAGFGAGPLALAAALPEDWELRGFTPCERAHRSRVFTTAAAAAAVPAPVARAVRAARIAAFGAWAAADVAGGGGGLAGYDVASGLYTAAGGAPPPALAPAARSPPQRFPAPPPAPLPPPAPALRHSLSFAALSLNGTAATSAVALPRVPSAEGDIWAPPLQQPPSLNHSENGNSGNSGNDGSSSGADGAHRRSSTAGGASPLHRVATCADPLNAACAGLGPQLLVLDAPNIAMRAGRGRACRAAGVAAAAEFWRRRGHVVIGFAPAPMLEALPAVIGTNPGSTLLPPDDPQLLRRMVDDGLLVPTPAGDYDDAYALAYAQRHGGVLVSNDRYADAVATAPPGARRAQLVAFLRAHACTFAFVGDEFLPNPAFQFPRRFCKEEAPD